jgi:flavin-dependent dehydrogenase
MPTHDVVVAGAAPAGSLAALILARAGYRVALVDRAAFPRAKVCGNCVNPSAWAIWDQLGLTESFRELAHQEFSGFAVHCEGRQLHEHAFATGQSPRAIGRDIFDDWLRHEAQRAGAEFLPETTVTSLDPATGTVGTSRGPLSGRLVLGADGRNSLVARLSGLMPAPRRCHRVAWQLSVPAPDDLDDRVHMHIFEEGYFGFCRYNDEQAVISLVLDTRRSKDPTRIVRRIVPDVGPGADWLRMSPITRAPAQAGTGRVWLVGDAARVVEPFTGEGIVFALSTAQLAAEAAIEGLARNDLAHALTRYAQAHRRLYRRRAWVNTLVRWTLTTPAHLVHFARKVDRLPAGLLSVLANRVHAAT